MIRPFCKLVLLIFIVLYGTLRLKRSSRLQMRCRVRNLELGLTKLTPQEINKLSDWINNFDKSNLKQNQAFPDNEDRFVITSQIDGSFRGWDGKTVFRLKNGQIWQQRLSGKWRYFAEDPPVEITKNFFGYFVMRVKR
ncbi:MAG: hypothetical protein CM15mP51_01160 [Porticoccaceae bacterium]|nr:MAG: hypothetical protein CM15mP51_01160 [Porticoccaceae bacterium]